MFKYTTTKTLYDKRWAILAWGLGFAITIVFIVVLFPSFKDPQITEAFEKLPKELQSISGSFDINTIDKYLDAQVFFNNATFILIILGISMGVSLLVSEEDRGTLETLLSAPISRTRLYLEKLLSLAIISLIVVLFGMLGTIVGLLIVGEWVSMVRLVQTTLMLIVFTLLYGTFALSIGAITGSKRLAITIPTVTTVAMYIIYTFSFAVKQLNGWEKLTWNYYFTNSKVIVNGINYVDLSILMLFIGIFIFAGWYWFRDRDISQ